MKNASVLLLAGMALLFVACKQPAKGKNGVTYTTALQYNDYITNAQKDIVQLVIRFFDAGRSNDLEGADKILDTAIVTTQQHIANIAGMPAWDGDSTFRDATLTSLRWYLKTFTEDYRSIVNMQKDGTVTLEEEAEYNRRTAMISTTEAQLDSRLKQAQLAFAEKNKIIIQPTQLQKEVNQRIQKQ